MSAYAYREMQQLQPQAGHWLFVPPIKEMKGLSVFVQSKPTDAICTYVGRSTYVCAHIRLNFAKS